MTEKKTKSLREKMIEIYSNIKNIRNKNVSDSVSMTEKEKAKSLGEKIIEACGTVEDIRNENLSTVLKLFDCYKSGKVSKHDFDIIISHYCHKGIPLPSGRYGNVLALALEMKELDIASEILDASDIETDSISSEFGGNNKISLTDYINEQRKLYDESDMKKLDALIAKAITTKEEKVKKDMESAKGPER